MTRILLITCVSAALLGCGTETDRLGILALGEVPAVEARAESPAPAFFPVTKVIDGDTFWIDNGTEKGEKVRLIGIDAPESRDRFDRKEGYYGKESAAYLERLLQGKRVKLEYDVQRYDRYHRILAYVYLEDGTFVNAHLVRQGYATAYTVPPNVKFADHFNRLQQQARKAGSGLWKRR